MADVIRINIELTRNREKLLIIPERVEVPQFSVVEWNIINVDRDLYPILGRYGSLVFTLYFENNSPFRWKRQFIQIFEPRFEPFLSKTIRLVEDVADEKGDFKYGVKVVDAEKNETIYDEDPLLIVI